MTTHPNYKMTVDQVVQARQRVASGETVLSVAETMDLPETTVRDAVRGRTWTELDAACPPVPSRPRGGEDRPRTPQPGEAGYVDPFGDVTPTLSAVHQGQKADHQDLEWLQERHSRNEPYLRAMDCRMAGLGLDVEDLVSAVNELAETVASLSRRVEAVETYATEQVTFLAKSLEVRYTSVEDRYNALRDRMDGLE